MPLANCIRCDALFNKVSNNICPKCLEEEEKLLKEAKKFLRENRNATMAELILEMDIEEELIEKWIQEKRINLVLEGEIQNVKKCTSCGRPVKSGQTICPTCQFKKMSKEKSTPEESPQEKPKKGGMYFKRDD